MWSRKYASLRIFIAGAHAQSTIFNSSSCLSYGQERTDAFSVVTSDPQWIHQRDAAEKGTDSETKHLPILGGETGATNDISYPSCSVAYGFLNEEVVHLHSFITFQTALETHTLEQVLLSECRSSMDSCCCPLLLFFAKRPLRNSKAW